VGRGGHCARLKWGLDDHHDTRQRGDQTVARQEGTWVSGHTCERLAQQGPLLDNLVEQGLVVGRVRTQQAGRKDRDRRTATVERTAMRFTIDPERAARHHGTAGLRELTRERVRKLRGLRIGPARAHDGDGTRQTWELADQGQRRRWVRELCQGARPVELGGSDEAGGRKRRKLHGRSSARWHGELRTSEHDDSDFDAQAAPVGEPRHRKVSAASAAPAGKPGLEEYRDQGFLQLGLGTAKVGLSPEMQTLAGVMAPAREQAVEVRAGQALHVTVEWQGCFSRCDTEVQASCSVEQAGPVLRVSSLFSRITAGPDVPCTEACQRQVAVCKTPKLKAGSYTVAFGEQSLSVRVPGPLDRTILHVAPGR